jgi:hypothetical protein
MLFHDKIAMEAPGALCAEDLDEDVQSFGLAGLSGRVARHEIAALERGLFDFRVG